MALLQTISLSHFPTTHPSIVSSFNKPPRHVSLSPSEISLFSGVTNLVGTAVDRRFFLPSTRPRKLLCAPPQGKHIREDYLVKKLSAQQIHDLVKGGRNVPIILDFYATWCGPCILMAQELEMLAVEYEKNAMIVKVDTDDEYEFARDMQVRGLPTLFFISPDPNKDAIRTEGLIPIQMMRDIIDNDM